MKRINSQKSVRELYLGRRDIETMSRVELQDAVEVMLEQLEQIHALPTDDDKIARGLRFTVKEAQVFALMRKRMGMVCSKQAVMDFIYANSADEPEIKIVDVFVCKMRAKIRRYEQVNGPLAWRIDTVWGRGYQIVSADKPLAITYDAPLELTYAAE